MYRINNKDLYYIKKDVTIKYNLNSKTIEKYEGEVKGHKPTKSEKNKFFLKFWNSKQWEWQYNGEMFKTDLYNDKSVLIWYKGRIYVNTHYLDYSKKYIGGRCIKTREICYLPLEFVRSIIKTN